MALDQSDPTLRDPAVRKGEFRETARLIVWRDRDSKKAGRSVDTGGAIARALESAYQLGRAHSGADGLGERRSQSAEASSPNTAIPWHTIPPRPRQVFERILRHKWIVVLAVDAAPWTAHPDKWACYWDWGPRKPASERIELAQTFSRSTLAPIVRLGLMEEKVATDGRTFLVPTPKAETTWKAALAAGNVQPD